jgi:hypothetical protein
MIQDTYINIYLNLSSCGLCNFALVCHEFAQIARNYKSQIVAKFTESTTDGSETKYLLFGKLHRDDGPALVYSSGTLVWCQYDKLYRDNGPVIIYPGGSEYWYPR